MISAGIVVEYNPFHNGHAYHLQKTREITRADVIIAVMSGNFLQRGEPALISKFSRAKMALLAGVDLVVELPYAYSTQKAEIFASGAVEILSALQSNYLVFGSESGNITNFQDTIDFLLTNKDQHDHFVQIFMNKGMSYPKANALAFQQLQTPSHLLDLSKPNDILGYHYVKAIYDTNSGVVPKTIQRVHSDYHDEQLSKSKISSATSIRNQLFGNGDVKDIQSHVPYSTYDELVHFKSEYTTFVHWENLWPYLKYQLLHSEPADLQHLYEIEEGMENRMIRFAKEATSFDHFMNQLKTKRYTWTRLQRACIHVLTNTKKEEMLQNCMKPKYIRILGLNDKGRNYLKYHKDSIPLPIISKLSQARESDIRLDVKASHMYSFAFPTQIGQQIIRQEYQQPPIII